MEQISPITETSVTPYVGRPVCAVLQDGTHYYGTLEKMDGGNLVINGYVRRPGEVETYALNKKRSMKKGKTLKTSAFFPGFGFQRFFLPLATLSLLFALPFLGFPFFI